MIPNPSIPAEKVAHGKAESIQLLSFFNSPATANANGMVVDAKPKNNTGGCITIQ